METEFMKLNLTEDFLIHIVYTCGVCEQTISSYKMNYGSNDISKNKKIKQGGGRLIPHWNHSLALL